ncbi:LD-carboxypeptidase [Parasediminibacterium sp. JCM 36343]|uniref:S66 peptidase family protein n=1 Tax=Parasediminibacterium sp. JCM 36343 TaxID=3374279 RepID=UPI00397AF186
MILTPPYLTKGDTIGIVCPSGYMQADKVVACIETLQQWGYTVKTGKTVGGQHHYFSGTDAERKADFQEMLDDRNVKAILCGRGGYGLSRIIDDIDFTKFKQNPKWIIGFSDITVLHAHIHQQLKIATLHAPMAAAFNDDGFKNEYVQSVKAAIAGDKYSYFCPSHTLNKIGTAQGQLIGGNLSIVAHLIGTKSSYDTAGKILFLEDVGEYLYHIDRLFIQLKRNGMLDNLAALVVGGFTDMKDTTIPFGEDIYAIINHHLTSYQYPLCFDFPVGHQTNNYALKVGVVHELKITSTSVQLKEI